MSLAIHSSAPSSTDSLFNVLTPIPIVSTLLEMWKTHMLFIEFSASWVIPPSADIHEKAAIYERTTRKLVPLANFVKDVYETNTWSRTLLRLAVCALAIIFSPVSIADLLISAWVITSISQYIQCAYVIEQLKKLVSEIERFTPEFQAVVAPSEPTDA